MMKYLWNLVLAVLLGIAFAGSVLADEIRGTIAKSEGREITVKSKDGKEVKVKVSGSRTAIEGGSRDDLKEGVRVSVEYSGDAASKISISKGK
jgi:outer membrane lipoprotein SlyB